MPRRAKGSSFCTCIGGGALSAELLPLKPGKAADFVQALYFGGGAVAAQLEIGQDAAAFHQI